MLAETGDLILMKSRSIHRILFSPLFLFIACSLSAQQETTIKTGIDKNRIVIGEQINLSLEAHFPIHQPMRFFTIDSIPHFEILERKRIDTIDNSEGIRLSQSLTLTSFDSGHWVIPPFELPGDTVIRSDSMVVDVGFSPFDSTKDYHDIKDVIDVQVKEKKKADWYWYAAASALLVAAIIYFLTRKKKQTITGAPALDPFNEAKKELEKLRAANPSSKLFYTGLVDIFRIYLSRRTGIQSLQKTTDDLVVQIRALKMPSEEFNRVAQILRMSDFVKFAKYEPTTNDRDESFKSVSDSIERIEKMQLQKEAKTQS